MVNIIKFGSVALDGKVARVGALYREGSKIVLTDTAAGNVISWVFVNGLLIADQCVLINISWNDLSEQDFVFGKRVNIDGAAYTCRLLKAGGKWPEQNEWDTALAATSTEDNLWHWEGMMSWCQDVSDEDPDCCVYRGYHTARLWGRDNPEHRFAVFGFRPVLEPLYTDVDHVDLDARLQVWCGQSRILGQLTEVTSYDIMLAPEAASQISESDLGKSVIKMDDGRLVINRSAVAVVQTLKAG